MAENDGRVRTAGAADGLDSELPADTVKTNPVDKVRLPEEDERAAFYSTAGEKDTLPEYEARRTTYPHIVAEG